MAQRTLYIDTDDNQIVTSESDQTPAPFPQLVQGDTISLRIFLLSRNKSFPFSNPYSIINNADLTMRAGIGPKNGVAGSTLYTSQFTWAQDALNQYFSGDFPLNTTGIASVIGSGESANLWFEIEITGSNGFPWTVLQRKIDVQAEVIESPALTTPAGLTALSAEDANALFLKRKISGVIYLEDINNPGLFIGLWNENGSLQTTPNIALP